ncbi:hypothetical protein OB2597_20241 [Pseudooceanicola batsensis HTCC2597]|uniref:Uncharacterized protein n=1 Tax=Pseudooceanicola batsensis (strain ATCC BAA-863 / DSM 15984 / KCTC 12145 / HTCC2597) TaxID=252305 RepID=A3U108_PSEBH|nr:hypothetical protein [Pseudooceanicola batsensis]EAQ01991.1 hypothetical protein OB2597_20241 [Pseudooceanicola batsensis HTCC2597]
MKKSHIVLTVLPLLCALGGFGAGKLMSDGPHPAHAGAQDLQNPQSPAEEVLHFLAEQEGHAARAQDDRHSAFDALRQFVPASLTFDDAGSRPGPVDLHRVDRDKLAAHAEKRAREEVMERARQKVEQSHTAYPVTKRPARTAHPSLLPVKTEAEIHEGAIKKIADTDDHVVRLGRLTVPVYSARAISYFVADFGVSVTDLDQANHYYDAENAARLRDQIVTTMHTVAETQLLRGSQVDSAKVAERVARDLRTNFYGIEDFIFLSLYKTEVPRG